MIINYVFNVSSFKHGVEEIDIRMAIMTEEEADALDELLTKTTPKVNSAVKGITAQKGFKMITIDDYSAEYITSKAIATRQTPEEIIHALVARDLTGDYAAVST